MGSLTNLDPIRKYKKQLQENAQLTTFGIRLMFHLIIGEARQVCLGSSEDTQLQLSLHALALDCKIFLDLSVY